MKQTTKELIQRCFILFIGLTVIAFGVVFSIKAGLGTSPIASVPYVINQITPLSVGTATIIMHCTFIFLQILLLKKQYELFQLLQLPAVIVFGYMTDLAIYLLRNMECHSYIQQWLFCFVGIVLIAIGVSLEVTANVVTLAAEGLILAICKVFSFKFGNMKTIFDVSLVCISIALSLIFLKDLVGVREGTVAAAFLVGILVKQVNKPLKKVTLIRAH